MATKAGESGASASSAPSRAAADSSVRGGHSSNETKRPPPRRCVTVGMHATLHGTGPRGVVASADDGSNEIHQAIGAARLGLVAMRQVGGHDTEEDHRAVDEVERASPGPQELG